jgi:hypothetical protein
MEDSMMKKLSDVIDAYFAQKKELHAAFGYDPNLAEESPLEDQRRMHWMLVQLERGYMTAPKSICVFSTEPFTKDSVASGKILFGGPVGSSVLRTETHALVGIVPRTGFEPKTGLAIRYSALRGQVLTIFDAALECKDPAIAAEYAKRWGGQ